MAGTTKRKMMVANEIFQCLNVAGCMYSSGLMVYAMRETHKDDACPHLVRFEWVFLATLILSGLEQARGLFMVQCGSGPTMLAHFTVWASGILFSRYLIRSFR